MSASFLNALIVKNDGLSIGGTVAQEFDYHLGTPNGFEVVKVPADFKTDFASIPKIFWNILPPEGPYGPAAVVHDWLYQRRRITGVTPSGNVSYVRYAERAEADAILNEAMGVLNVSGVDRFIIYRGVRLGGWATWSKYRAQETA